MIFARILVRGYTPPFHPEKLRLWSKNRGEQGKFPVPLHLTPVARRVAACGPICGLAGRRWGTDTTRPIYGRVGELFGVPKKQQEKGVASCAPPPRSLLSPHTCPQAGVSEANRPQCGRLLGRRCAGSCGIPPPALWSGVFGGQWGRKQKKSRSYGTTCGVTAKF